MCNAISGRDIAYEKKKPIFLIGGFGGCAHVIANIIEGKANSKSLSDVSFQDEIYVEFLEWAAKYDHKVDYGFFDQIKIEDLNNGLNPVDNLRLFKSVDIIEIVSLVLKGLKNI